MFTCRLKLELTFCGAIPSYIPEVECPSSQRKSHRDQSSQVHPALEGVG